MILGAGVIGLSRAQAPWQLYRLQHRHGGRLGGHHDDGDRDDAGAWFDRRRGMAISLALNGASTGGFIIAPLLVRFGHRMGLEQAVPLLGAWLRWRCCCRWCWLGVGRPPVDGPHSNAPIHKDGAHADADGFAVADQPVAGACATCTSGSFRCRSRWPWPRRSASSCTRWRSCCRVWATTARAWPSRHRDRRHRRAVGAGRRDRPVEPAPRLGRQLRQSGRRAGPDAGAAGRAGRALRRQRGVRPIGRQRHHAARR